MNKKQVFILTLVAMCTALLGTLYTQIYPIQTDVLTSLSRSYFDQEFSSAYKKYENGLSHQVLILIEAKDKSDLDALVSSAKTVKSRLNDSGLFLEFKNIVSIYQDLNRFYFKNRDKLLSISQIELIKTGQFSVLEKIAQRSIYSPFFTSAYKLKEDPFLLSDDFVSSHTPPIELTPYEGFQLIATDSSKVFLKGEIKNGLGLEALTLIDRLNLEVEGITIYASSLSFYSAAAKVQAVNESSFFSVLSMLAIFGIFWFYFRSPRHLVIAITSILACCMVGFYLTSIVFGGLHLLTILLGISILGIMADYFIHFFVNESSGELSSGRAAFKEISKPLFWSLGTSVCGFLMFLLAPLPILKQFSLFTSGTLLAAFFCVKYFLPLFYQKQSSVKGDAYVLNEVLYQKMGKLKVIFFVAPFLIFGMGTYIHSQDLISSDIREFSAPNERLRGWEDEIRKALGINFGFELYIVRGETAQQLLANEQRLKTKLSLSSNEVEFFSDWVPSLASQELSQSAYKRLSNYPSIDTGPIQPESFIELFGAVEFSKLWLGKIGDHFFSIVPLYTKLAENKVKESPSKNWTYMNKVGFINRDLAKFIDWLIASVTGFFILFFTALFFKLGKNGAIKIVTPPLVGIGMSLSFSFLIKGHLDLFNFLGCVLIFSLGVDYAFFYYFNRRQQPLSAKGIEISTLTTLASFGVLALSSTQAVYSFGLTVLIGIFATWIFVPMSANMDNYEK